MVLALVLIPYPMKLDAKGKAVPLDRAYIFPPFDARVDAFLVKSDAEVAPGEPVARMYRHEFHKEINELKTERTGLQAQIALLYRTIDGTPQQEKQNAIQNRITSEIKLRAVQDKLNNYSTSYYADIDRPGYFEVRAPEHRPSAQSGCPAGRS